MPIPYASLQDVQRNPAFLRQQWYAAAWSTDIPAGGCLTRTILEEPILFWRNSSGLLSAVSDTCPHRWAPLSKGQIDDNGVRCGYHGLRFDGQGRCVENPHGPVLASLRVRAYPLTERYGMIWVWMGDQSPGSVETIPDLSFVDSLPETAIIRGYLYTKADHRLLEDNILDLSHADYLHPDTLGGGSMTRSKATVEERGDRVWVQWLSSDEPPIPAFRPLMPAPEAPADAWTEVLWHPNGAMILRAGATPMGAPPEAGIDTWNAHLMTPETATTTHYFHVNTRNYLVDDAAYNAAMADALRQAFENEDKPMIEAQQERLGARDLFAVSPKLLPIDNGSTRARRIYERLLQAEFLSADA